MWQWEESANSRIGIASKPHRIFADIAYQAFLTTSSIGLWVRMLKFWSLPRIVGARATGWAGFNWLIDLTCTGHRPCAGRPRNPSSAGSFCGRDGACQTPSYWSTRNRSSGTRHPAFTKGSTLSVLPCRPLTKLPVARYCFCCPVGRLSIDRFLVLQYEGKRQMPSRAYKANSVNSAPPTFQHCQNAA